MFEIPVNQEVGERQAFYYKTFGTSKYHAKFTERRAIQTTDLLLAFRDIKKTTHSCPQHEGQIRTLRYFQRSQRCLERPSFAHVPQYYAQQNVCRLPTFYQNFEKGGSGPPVVHILVYSSYCSVSVNTTITCWLGVIVLVVSPNSFLDRGEGRGEASAAR